ncbi:UDP-N-acetylmuramoyl-L-alanyl-D-glutamate--2,6-diaminopimelate ligase [Candidatus Babeliales bacterium]|nr:UDP-N-acetylmuramoyl-L-alanyl-D-glutamate--2,6-diaminopimelate ligase [Candidatus Babeliales bacterium]
MPQTFPVTAHTKYVGPGSMFVAVKGHLLNGEDFISQAIEHGATKIVLDKTSEQLVKKFACDGVEFIFVDDCRKSLAELSAQALGYPAKKLSIIGVTGTKGKTTTTFLVEHVLREAGYKTALLGGVKNKILDESEKSDLTTHGADYLQMFFTECLKRGVTHVVMEVSSHALALDRLHGIEFDAVGFTNLAWEHIDFHETMFKYFQAKSRIFEQVKKDGVIVINTDDKWGALAAKKLANKKVISLGSSFSIEKNNLDGLRINLKNGCKPDVAESEDWNKLEVPKLFGKFNAYNIVMAVKLCEQFGISFEKINKALKIFSGVPGRLQKHVLKNGAVAFVDFAHNSSSMKSVLSALRFLTNHLIVVFGCGGDRDKAKRSKMGRIASMYGDEIIVTDDNPRHEDPLAIRQEILKGVVDKKSDSVTCVPDRHEAIAHAVACSRDGSIIAILGKGHEEYNLVRGKKYNFNDIDEIEKY